MLEGGFVEFHGSAIGWDPAGAPRGRILVHVPQAEGAVAFVPVGGMMGGAQDGQVLDVAAPSRRPGGDVVDVALCEPGLTGAPRATEFLGE